jgi:hypothetical protein
MYVTTVTCAQNAAESRGACSYPGTARPARAARASRLHERVLQAPHSTAAVPRPVIRAGISTQATVSLPRPAGVRRARTTRHSSRTTNASGIRLLARWNDGSSTIVISMRSFRGVTTRMELGFLVMILWRRQNPISSIPSALFSPYLGVEGAM